MDLVRVERGQLVLVAAAVIALALAPVLLAYLQLGYHPDVESDPDVSGTDAVEYLDRWVHAAVADTAGGRPWANRAAMAEDVRAELEGPLEDLETARLDEGVAYVVAYNATAAAAWAGAGCPRGSGRAFGDCETDGGIVLQERAGETVVLAVAFDVRTVGSHGESSLVVVVEFGA